MNSNSDHFKRDSFGRTPLFYTADSGNLAQVRNIIYSLAGTGISCQRLSLITMKDSFGMTATDMTEHAGHKDISELLRSEQIRVYFYVGQELAAQRQ